MAYGPVLSPKNRHRHPITVRSSAMGRLLQQSTPLSFKRRKIKTELDDLEG